MRRTLLGGGVAAGLTFLLLFLWTPTCVAGAWYLDDGHPPNIWGTTDQYGQFTHLEAMSDGCISNGVFAYLDPDTNYVAMTQELMGDYFNQTFQAVLFMKNTSPSQNYPVICTLRVSQTSGSVINWVTIGTDTVYVTHDGTPPPVSGPMYHRYDFGVCNVHTQNETLELVIDYNTSSGNTTHTVLYWDGQETYGSNVCCYAATTPSDRVVCEYTTGTQPAHPDTYWYDVTPVATRRDFHVRIYDGGHTADYSNWVQPTGWAHTIRSHGCGRWLSWYAPTAAESMLAYATYRFGFTNPNAKTWGDWTTTVSGTTSPYVSVADSSGAHSAQPDGYGARVHVPKKQQNGTLPALTPLPDGFFEGDAVFDDFDGVAVLAICGETDTSTENSETHIYEWNGSGFDLLQILEGVSGTGSGALAWGDFNEDGWPDLAVAGKAGAVAGMTRVFRNDGGNLVWDGQELEGLYDASLAWGDYDMDGIADLLAMGRDNNAVRRTIIYEHDGMGGFVNVGELVGLSNGSADWADIDGDGDPDLVTTGTDGSVRRTIFYEGNPPALPTPIGELGLPGIALSDTEWADYDRDGDPDLAFTGETSAAVKMARVYRNEGGLVLTQVADLMSVYRSSCAWGDYNLDGDLDVAFCGYDGAGLSTTIFENTGSGFVDSGFRLPGTREGALCFYDFDGDCDCDFFLSGGDWMDELAEPYENTVVDPVGIPDGELDAGLAGGRLLDVNYPNPFNPKTTIRFVVPESGDVELAVYDLTGRLVKRLVRASLAARTYETTWRGDDENGRPVGSGVYFCRLVTPAGRDHIRMVLVK